MMVEAYKDISKAAIYWRRAAIFISLLLVLLSAFFVILLVRGVDKELYYISLGSELRKKSEVILLNLLQIEKVKENFLCTHNIKSYSYFLHLSNHLENTLEELKKSDKTYHIFQDKLDKLQQEIKVKLADMRNIMYWSEMNKNAAAQIPTINQDDGSPLTERVRAFLTQEDESLQKRRYGLDAMRTALSFAAIVAIISTFILAYGVIDRFRRDLHDLRIYQHLLRDKNSQLEARVKERTLQLETSRSHAEKERQRVELLLQDTSHRIGNSLATVSSLLSLQANRSKNEEVKQALFSARDRIQTIATAHRRLRLGPDMETTSIGDFLQAVVRDIKLSIPADLQERIEITTQFQSFSICSRDATTLGIVAGELLTNAIKHAFPNERKGKVHIFFGKWENHKLSLVIEDNGVGIKEVLDEVEEAGLGKLVAKQLCLQFGAEPLYQRLRYGGTRVIIPLPALEKQSDPAETEEPLTSAS